MSIINNIHPSTPVTVSVTFLRMEHAPEQPLLDLPQGYILEKLSFVPVSLYKYIYETVGRSYCWWMRSVLSDQYLEQFFANPFIEVYLLKDSENIISGFFELDCTIPDNINIAYFGLMPHLVGQGLGVRFFHQALRHAWQKGPRCVRINTCNLDHPRALELYKKAGFEPFKVEQELWNIPDALNLPIPKKFIKK